MTLRERWRARRERWIGERHPRGAYFETRTRNIYILPTRGGYALLFFLAFTFLLAINFQNALVFGLFFWLLSIAILNLHFTHFNLSGIGVRCLRCSDGFAGATAGFTIEVQRNNDRARHAIELSFEGEQPAQRVDLTDARAHTVQLNASATRRGYLSIPRITISSVYPLGIARSWSYVNLTASALVYPAPVDAGVEAQTSLSDLPEGEHESRPGVTDFEQLRPYAAGDRISRVHWPASTRQEALQVKHFVDPVAGQQWIDWLQFPGLPIERRLEHFAHLIRARDAENHPYGLRLPGVEIPVDTGANHSVRCLRALATFGIAEAPNERGENVE